LDSLEKLKKHWKDKENDSALLEAARIGHYVADLHQPLHTTENYDGQLSGNRGIHSRFEHKMLKDRIDKLNLVYSSATYINDPLAQIFEVIRQGYPSVEKIMKADGLAQKSANIDSYWYFQRLFEQTKEICENRISGAIFMTASLWYTAWIDAGSPVLKQEEEK